MLASKSSFEWHLNISITFWFLELFHCKPLRERGKLLQQKFMTRNLIVHKVHIILLPVSLRAKHGSPSFWGCSTSLSSTCVSYAMQPVFLCTLLLIYLWDHSFAHFAEILQFKIKTHLVLIFEVQKTKQTSLFTVYFQSVDTNNQSMISLNVCSLITEIVSQY